MKLIHRIGYYLGGFTIGLIVLFFFLSGKRTSCDYGLDARVLKDIRNKERVFSEDTQQIMVAKAIDTAMISNALKNGDVNFSESNTNLDSCKIYTIEYKTDKRRFKFQAENCSKKATLSGFEVETID